MTPPRTKSPRTMTSTQTRGLVFRFTGGNTAGWAAAPDIAGPGIAGPAMGGAAAPRCGAGVPQLGQNAPFTLAPQFVQKAMKIPPDHCSVQAVRTQLDRYQAVNER